ncbi:hypothetical protein HDU76_003777 [Blyttiomyces sp. JEL0837]|nr:hypothetical protein HDU76_003777 [Blyttiomyces sp. JEL0837]
MHSVTDGQVNQQTPIRLAQDKLQVDTTAETIKLVGSARAYVFDKTKDLTAGNVKVHWTKDDWKTVLEDDATFDAVSKTWNYSLYLADPGLVPPYNIFYAFKYNSSAGVFWDNNNSQNYAHYIGANCQILNLPATINQSAGNITVEVQCATQTELDSFGQVTIFSLDGIRLNPTVVNGNKFNIDVSTLAVGKHAAGAELPVYGTRALDAASTFLYFNVVNGTTTA